MKLLDKINHKELFRRVKDAWKILRCKEHLILISTNSQEMKEFIDSNGNIVIHISVHNLVTYPTIVMLKKAADIVTDDEMILHKAEYQFKQDEYKNQRAREQLNKESNK